MGDVFSLPILRQGLQAVPYVTTALGLYDMFTAGGTAAPQKVAIMPMALNANIKLSGTISRTTNYTDITFSTPGSVPSSLLKEQPYYNEVLGVFNLLETPQINRTLDRVNYYDQEQTWWNAETHTYSYRLAKPIKYVINPASGLEVQDVQAAFMLRDSA